MMKFSMMAAAATMMTGLALPAFADDADIQGYWVTDGSEAVVEIAPCGTSAKRLCGTVVWRADGVAEATPGVGAELLTGFRPVVDWWEKGKVTDVKTGRTLVGKLKPTDDGKLVVSQCKGGLCTHSTWQRPSQDMAGLESFLTKAGS